jgi:hypothetical protein
LNTSFVLACPPQKVIEKLSNGLQFYTIDNTSDVQSRGGMTRVPRTLLVLLMLSPVLAACGGGDDDDDDGNETGPVPADHCENPISADSVFCDDHPSSDSWPLSELLVAGETYSVTFTPVSLPFTILAYGEPAECSEAPQWVEQTREYITEEGTQCIDFVADDGYPSVVFDYFISGILPSDNHICKGACPR